MGNERCICQPCESRLLRHCSGLFIRWFHNWNRSCKFELHRSGFSFAKPTLRIYFWKLAIQQFTRYEVKNSWHWHFRLVAHLNQQHLLHLLLYLLSEFDQSTHRLRYYERCLIYTWLIYLHIVDWWLQSLPRRINCYCIRSTAKY